MVCGVGPCMQQSRRPQLLGQQHYGLFHTHRARRRVQGTGKWFVGGNWKCNGDKKMVAQLVDSLNQAKIDEQTEVVVSPTFVHLQHVLEHLRPPITVAAQNCWVNGTGAYTGEISADQLKDLGVEWVILGHSERRSLLQESNTLVGEKCAQALSNGLKVIACIGETLDQREAGKLEQVVDDQLSAIADNISDFENVVVAYEPVWAIGTGKVASPEQAQEVHAHIREWFSERIGEQDAQALRIIYGGSVSEKTCCDLASKKDLDGFLVGGASLKGNTFAQICNAKSAVPA